ncbi:hypothetical protein [Pseudoalteromonas rubra]|uniref:Ig-like domain-containing protein n=1 Tax=Pseudoalteromonas rubra TaxID=43658 RepID=A0A0U3GR07_9GAMM|nr:hypothetical protein [Pseudoalteromonas rubra]ALU41635.1 hypothetical protein AT705_01080 [Pseudoalteromonas rubra]
MQVKQSIKRSVITALLGSALVTGCGGSSSSESPGSEGGSQNTNNNAPVLSVSGEQSILEQQAFTLNAAATDSDGSVVSLDWLYESDLITTVSKHQDGSATFTSEDIMADHQVVFTAVATDDKGATTKQAYPVTIKRRVASVTLNGIVTDEPIANASVSIEVAGQTKEVAADAQGTYSAQVTVDESEADALVRIVALGGADQTEVKFVSQLNSVSKLLVQAGEDKILSKDENFSVNVTNVTTAEYALLTRGDNTLSSDDGLSEALLNVDADEKLQLAALIKIVVDNDEYTLPEGVNSTLELVADKESAAQFEKEVESKDPTLIDQTRKEIIEDDELVSGKAGSMAGDYIIHSPAYRVNPVYHLQLDEAGTGSVAAMNQVSVKEWTQNEGVVQVLLTEPLVLERFQRTRSDEFGGWVVDESGQYVHDDVELKTTQLTLHLLADNAVFYTVELDSHAQEFVNGELNLGAELDNRRIINLQGKTKTLQVNTEELTGKTWYLDLDNFSNKAVYRPSVVTELVFNQDGSVTQLSEADTQYTSWTVQDTLLTLNYKHDEVEASKALWVTKSLSAGYQVVVLDNQSVTDFNDGQANSVWGWLIPEQNTPQVSSDSMVGRWTGFIGYSDNFHDMVVRPGLDVWIGLNDNRHDGRVEDGIFYREPYRVNEGRKEPVCVNSEGPCQAPYQFKYEFIAQAGNNYFVKRSFINNPGSAYEDDTQQSLIQYQYSPEYDYSGFSESAISGSVTFYSVSDMGLPTEVSIEERDGAFILKTLHGEYVVNFVDGKLSYELNGKTMYVEIVENLEIGLTVCIYDAALGCQENNKVNWYFTPQARPSYSFYLTDPERFSSRLIGFEYIQGGDVQLRLSNEDLVAVNLSTVDGTLVATPKDRVVSHTYVTADQVTVERVYNRVTFAELGGRANVVIHYDEYHDEQLVREYFYDYTLKKVHTSDSVPIEESSVTGDWLMSEARGKSGKFDAARYQFAPDGTGVKSILSDSTNMTFNWALNEDGNLIIEGDAGYRERLTLTKTLNVGYQYLLETSTDFTVRLGETVGFMVKQQQVEMSQDEYIGRWLYREGQDVEGYSLGMEIYEDMTVRFGTFTSSTQGRYVDGQFVRTAYQDTETGTYYRYCPPEQTNCVLQREMRYTPLAQDGDVVYLLRDYLTNNEGQIQYHSATIFAKEKQAAMAINEFTDYLAEFWLRDEANRIWHSSETTLPGGEQTFELRLDWQEAIPFKLQNGKIAITMPDGIDYLIEIVPGSNTKEGITFCQYPTGSECTADKHIKMFYVHTH